MSSRNVYKIQLSWLLTILFCVYTVDATCGVSSTTCDDGYHVVDCNVTRDSGIVGGTHCAKDNSGPDHVHYYETWQFWVGIVVGLLVVGTGITVFTCIKKQKIKSCRKKHHHDHSDPEKNIKHGHGPAEVHKEEHHTHEHHDSKLHSGKVQPTDE